MISATFLSAQTFSEVTISFQPMYENVLLSLNENYGKDGIQKETLKFYISEVEFYKENEMMFAEENSYHLLDAAEVNSLC